MAGKSASPVGASSGSDEQPPVIDGTANSGVENNGPELVNGQPVIDPASLGDEYERDGDGNLVIGAGGKPRRKRGRKSGGSGGGSSGGSAGSTGKTGARNSQTLKQGIDTLSKTLMILHMGIAGATKFDTFNLEEKEADALAASLANVLDQFDWAPDPRFTAVAGLVTTSATIYGPRLYLYREHLKEQRGRNRPKANEPGNGVTDMSAYPINGFGGTSGLN